MKEREGRLGCIADDFTGAGDLASFLAKGGMKTVLFCGSTEETAAPTDADAVVIPLKSRTAPVPDAVRDTLLAADFLKRSGCTQFYFKYCSTFDSTPKGNIGPVVDALLEYLDARYTILCPALPVNGRTVKDGVLYVNGIPLAKSTMRNHPLTPMWASRISELMKEQGRYPCLDLGAEDYSLTEEALTDKIERDMEGEPHFYVVPDLYEERHAEELVRLFGRLPLLTGGSGLAWSLAGLLGSGREEKPWTETASGGPAILVAGSVSAATLEQIRCYKEAGLPFRKIDPWKLYRGETTAEEICERSLEEEHPQMLIYCTESEADREAGERIGKERFAALLEETLARIVELSVKRGAKRVIAAGGETSGAVMKALGFERYLIGESVAPGVPVMIPAERPDMRVILKSGNFGQEDFFIRAVRMTEKRNEEVG